jgi:hypothetical protein
MIETVACLKGTPDHQSLLPGSTVVPTCSVIFALSLIVGVTTASGQVLQERPDSQTANTSRPIDPETAPRPTALSTLAASPIEIDGRLDEPSWQDARSFGDFIQSKPDAGYPATEPTVVRLLHDAEKLYISAVCYLSDADHLTITSLERDFETLNSDAFGVAFDTFLDRSGSFMFFVNPKGAVRDAQSFDDARIRDLAWDGILEVRTQIDDTAWTVEMAIPWTSLRFDPAKEEQAWGANFFRRVRHKNEDSFWAPIDRRNKVYTMSKAGTVRGLGSPQPGRNLQLKPYVRAANIGGSRPVETDRGGDYDAGMDLKYGITPGMVLDLTYRTDFSQVDVDREQVNLTRFSLFFPEQREFFVENSGLFTVSDALDRQYRTGASARDFSFFHSRRIGLTDGGRPIPIIGGGRLTGRIGGSELGLLNMQTASTEETAPENFTVLRFKRKLFGNASIGGMFLNRQVTDESQLTGGGSRYNRGYSMDASIGLFGRMMINSYLAITDSPGEESDGVAGRVAVAWRDQLLNISAFAKHVDDTFDPRLGYVKRRGINHGYATIGVHPRFNSSILQELNPYGEVHFISNLDDVLETRQGTLGLGVTFVGGSRLTFRLDDNFERIFESFNVSGNATVEPGDYDYRTGSVSFRSSAGRPLYGNVSFSTGGFWDGNRTSAGLGVTWRADYRISLSLNANRNQVSFPDTDFTADVYGARVKFSPTTRISTSAFVQYNQSTDEMITNIRFNFIHAPRSDLFVVYTERRSLNEAGLLDQSITVKFTKLLVF